ncbi:hypothetical protein DENSPDRAFT_72747 [Dentipellis sp. KUC8613]|nr:hypothetical protein DENSPDRAFT_72747 [Dentipellis sp. KUC8613]
MAHNSLSLTREEFIDLAQHALRPTKCDWQDCSMVLNSLNTLREHLHLHCMKRHKNNTFYCGISRCSGRYHGSLEAIFNHIDLSHLNRAILLCPIKGCYSYEEFTRQASLITHFEMAHPNLLNQHVMISEALVPLSKLGHHLPQNIPPIPPTCLSSHISIPPIICTKSSGFPILSQGTAPGKKWRQLKQEEDDKEEEEIISHTFSDLPPSPSQAPLPLTDLPVISSSYTGSKQLSLSRPLPVSRKPTVPSEPPESMGYRIFSLRVMELEHQGILAGNGFWPEEQQKSEHGDSPIPQPEPA